MTKTTGTPTPSASSPGDATKTNDSSNQVTALLLDVLRNINREVRTTTELNGFASRAIENFRIISDDLRTVSDAPPPSPSSTRC